ncbi:MAG TPA: NUDIX hydrolase [Planococcus sp. (in: firmicutes)]|nr:NUDIX hydrolase [Planococcus sp. (in: firmicutes)]
MTNEKRGNVWLGAAGLVVNSNQEWLVVKKRYGGLQGKWSLPAGFVSAGETIDEAALREVWEETGVDCEIIGMIGFRSGVIKEKVSDNMGVFLMKPKEHEHEHVLTAQISELYEAAWMAPEKLAKTGAASVMLHEMAEYVIDEGFQTIEGVDPGEVFGYSAYKLFFKK